MKNHALHAMYNVRKPSRSALIFTLSILFFASSFVMLIAAYHLEQRAQAPTDASILTPYKIGTTIKQGAVSMAVDSVSYSDGSAPFTAPTGKHYAIVTLTVKNRTDQAVNILPASDTYAKDTAGNVVYLTPFALESPFRAGELPPGDQVRGQLSYLVPKDRSLKLYIDAIWSGGVIPITINQ